MSILFEALFARYPNTDFAVQDGQLEWRSTSVPAPTQEEVDAIVEEFKLTMPPENELALNWYDLRRIKYPSIEEQLDLIYHQGLEAWKNKIEAVKLAYPKPEALPLPTPSSGDIPVTEP